MTYLIISKGYKHSGVLKKTSMEGWLKHRPIDVHDRGEAQPHQHAGHHYRYWSWGSLNHTTSHDTSYLVPICLK